jgi:hypothetical protein
MAHTWFGGLILGISIGVILSIVIGVVYIVVLKEPGPPFYAVAGLACLGSPLISGIAATVRIPQNKRVAFVISSGITFGIAFMLSALLYVVSPQFARTSVQLPASCDDFDGSFDPPAYLTYTLPEFGAGILITSDTESAVVAMIDYEHAPYPSDVLLVNTSDNVIIQSMSFPNDIISGAIDRGVLYLFNDKLGYLIDARTGELEQNFLIVDNYGGLSESDRPIISRASDGRWYFETTAVISSWNIDGTVISRRHLTFNGIVRGCYISGDSHDVTPF